MSDELDAWQLIGREQIRPVCRVLTPSFTVRMMTLSRGRPLWREQKDMNMNMNC